VSKRLIRLFSSVLAFDIVYVNNDICASTQNNSHTIRAARLMCCTATQPQRLLPDATPFRYTFIMV